MRLKNKVALVSGSGSGIGEATAKRLASEGAAVVVVDLNEEGANRVAAEIKKAGGAAEALKANVGNPSEVEGMVKFAIDKFGQLDILHNNAIRLYTGRIGEMTLENWRKAVDIGLTSYWYATRCALNVMVPQGRGAIVNTASVSGLAADYGLGAYNAIKAGVINLTRATAIDRLVQEGDLAAISPTAGSLDVRLGQGDSEEEVERQLAALAREVREGPAY